MQSCGGIIFYFVVIFSAAAVNKILKCIQKLCGENCHMCRHSVRRNDFFTYSSDARFRAASTRLIKIAQYEQQSMYNNSAQQLAALNNEVMTSQYVALQADRIQYAVTQYSVQCDVIAIRYFLEFDAADIVAFQLAAENPMSIRACTQATLVRKYFKRDGKSPSLI